MSNSIRELQEKKGQLVAESRKLLDTAKADNDRDLTGEEDQVWQRYMKDIDATDEGIRKADRKDQLEKQEMALRAIEPRKTTSNAPQATRQLSKSDRNKAWKNWFAYGHDVKGLTLDGDSYNRSADYGMPLHQNTLNLRSINTTSSSVGGAGTFTTTYDQIQTQMKYFSPIIEKCNVITTSDGNNFVLPRGTDTANTMAIVGQTSSSGTTTDPSFDKVTLGSYMFRYIELVTYEMLQDAVFDIEAWVTARLAERGARTMESYIVAGTGSSQPTGVLTSAVANGASVTLASGSAHYNFYRFDDLMTLFSSVDLAYRPNCTLVLNDSSVWDLRKIKDSNGRYIWDVNNTLVQNSQPDKVAGFNYLISNSIPASGTSSANIAVFADLSRQVVRNVDSIQITRLNELYRASGMIGFEVLMRFDCNYVGHSTSYAYAATPSS